MLSPELAWTSKLRISGRVSCHSAVAVTTDELLYHLYMLDASNNCSPNLFPVNACIELFVHKPTDCDVVSSHQIQPMTNFRTWFGIVRRSDDAFDGLVKDNVGQLVARK